MPLRRTARVSSRRRGKAYVTELPRETAVFCFQLYIAGPTPRCLAAYANLRRICEEYLRPGYSIEVIDLLLKPEMARSEQIFAIPTLVRRTPLPSCRVIGDLSNTSQVIAGMEIGIPEGASHPRK